jgi:cytochrome c peroxidase
MISVAEPIKPIPEKIEYNRLKARLGKKLFMDSSLSKDGKISCLSCHNFYSGADANPKSFGVDGAEGNMNSPTVFNAVFNFKQMWNGRARTLKEQVFLPLHNPKEMAIDEKKVLKYLNSSREYRELFKKIYNSPPSLESLADAIAEFEKALITPDSPFDKYLKKEHNLTPKEMKGYMLFKKLGCIICHNGVNVGGNSYQKFGLVKDSKRTDGVMDLYSITLNPFDRNIFKVPSLRNIEKTAPYFHDGHVKSLKMAIKLMAEYNFGFKLSKDDVDNIEAFLKTLTGKTPKILKEKI